MGERVTTILSVTAFLFLLFVVPCFAAEKHDTPGTAEARRRMVALLKEKYDIHDEKILEVMGRVPRHLFVPEHQRKNAYEDRPLPIGYGQTISQPAMVAYMTQLARIDGTSKVLEIGSGSGYQAAVLAETAEAVFTVEIIPELARRAEENLRRTGYGNVKVRQGDGYYGWPEEAPFDAIVVTAAAPHIPPPLMDQLEDGGRMIIPVGSPYRTQHLVLVEREGSEFRTQTLMPVRFVPLVRPEEP